MYANYFVHNIDNSNKILIKGVALSWTHGLRHCESHLQQPIVTDILYNEIQDKHGSPRQEPLENATLHRTLAPYDAGPLPIILVQNRILNAAEGAGRIAFRGLDSMLRLLILGNCSHRLQEVVSTLILRI
jgi:hypothetical protein